MKLNTRFQIKGQTAQIHKHCLIYYVRCPNQSCNQDYLGETGRRNIDRYLNVMAKANIHIHLNMFAMKIINCYCNMRKIVL